MSHLCWSGVKRRFYRRIGELGKDKNRRPAKTTTGWPAGAERADCFYVSAERARFPFFRGKPVGVIGNQGACCGERSLALRHLPGQFVVMCNAVA